jgi:HAD superfamily hydrolase (TIGR01549 family)
VIVIFDLDGTLTAGRLNLDGIKREMDEIFSERGVDVSDEFGIVEKIALGAAALGDPELGRTLCARLEEEEVAAADNAKSLPGTRGALEELRYRGLRMAVLSRNCRSAVDRSLERLDLSTFFESVITREDAPPKPLPDGVELIIGTLGGGPAVMVGDSTLDIMAGRNAGITTIGVLSGYASRKDLEASGADHIIDDVSQLPALLVRLKGR